MIISFPQVDPDVDFGELLRVASKKAVAKHLIMHTLDGKAFKTVTSGPSSTKKSGQTPKLKQTKLNKEDFFTSKSKFGASSKLLKSSKKKDHQGKSNSNSKKDGVSFNVVLVSKAKAVVIDFDAKFAEVAPSSGVQLPPLPVPTSIDKVLA